VQMDVSINPDVRDVRVLGFEDRHDCMKCLTVLRQWPEMAAVELSMGAVPSEVVEQEIRWVDAGFWVGGWCASGLVLCITNKGGVLFSSGSSRTCPTLPPLPPVTPPVVEDWEQ
jgi:hypothetical protein